MAKILKSLAFLFFILLNLNATSQTTVTGKVTTVENPNGLMGATIQEMGTNNTTATDKDGNFSLKISKSDAKLSISAIGFKTVTVDANGSLSISLVTDLSEFNQVTITANRTPTRKLQTTTAVEIIGAKALKAIKPEGIAEAVSTAPGLYVNTSQGRRGGIVTRGFPDGGNPQGGLDYTAILIDGLPSFGSTGRLPEAGFGFDNNVEKVEVVRGSAATLFGRSSAAGAINVISKTGGEKLGGSARFTSYNNAFDDGKKQLNYRWDLNLNGSLTKNKRLRFNIGGWFLDDKGFKNTGFNDKGHQVRGNIDYLIPNGKGKVRVFFMNSDFVFQNLTDIPADISAMKIAGGYKNTQTLQNFSQFYSKNYTVYESGGGFPSRIVLDKNGDSIVRSVRQAMQDNSYGKTKMIGTNIEYNLGKNITIEEKFRTQSMRNGTKYSFALPSYYLNNSVARLLLDGDSKDGDVVNELRLRARFTSENNVTHSLTAGHYYAATYLRPTTYSFLHVMNPSNPDDTKFAPLAPPFVNVPWSGSNDYPRGSITRRGEYTEKVTSTFFGDEVKVKEKLIINLGLRFDKVTIDMEETKKPYDFIQTRNASHKDWSASVGVNYLVSPKSAVYANITRAFRAPDYTAYTSLEWISFTDRRFLRATDGINANEIVFNTEAGYRTTVGDNLSFDIAAFRTKISNRLATIFENGILVAKPFGSNRIAGAELSISYVPEMVKGLSIRTNVTYQKAIFTDFKIPIAKGTGATSALAGSGGALSNVDINGNLFGNTLINEGGGNYSLDVKGKQLPGIPSLIWNTNINYLHDYFGVDASTNINANRYVDPTNVLKYNTLKIINFGAFARPKIKGFKDVRIGVQVKNLFNNNDIQNIAGLSASELTLGQKQRTPNYTSSTNVPVWGQGYAQLPRRWSIVFSLDF
jgi:outer membrane receptor protein involved in Fe transport